MTWLRFRRISEHQYKWMLTDRRTITLELFDTQIKVSIGANDKKIISEITIANATQDLLQIKILNDLLTELYFSNKSNQKTGKEIQYLCQQNEKIGKHIQARLQDNEGNTRLMLAVKSLSFISVKKLIDQTDIEYIQLKDKQLRTALHFACALGQNHMVTILLKAGAKMNVVDNKRKTPIDYAKCDLQDISSMLKEADIHPKRDSKASSNAVVNRMGNPISLPNVFFASGMLEAVYPNSTFLLHTPKNIEFIDRNAHMLKDQNIDRTYTDQLKKNLTGKTIAESCQEGQAAVRETLSVHNENDQDEQKLNLDEIQQIINKYVIRCNNTSWQLGAEGISILKCYPNDADAKLFLRHDLQKIELFFPFKQESTDVKQLKNYKMILTFVDELNQKSKESYQFQYKEDQTAESHKINREALGKAKDLIFLLMAAFEGRSYFEDTYSKMNQKECMDWKTLNWNRYKFEPETNKHSAEVYYQWLHESLTDSLLTYLDMSKTLQAKAIEGTTLISCGCADGNDITRIMKGIKREYPVNKAIGIDFSKDNIQFANENFSKEAISFIEGDIYDIEKYFPRNNDFNILFFIGVIARQVLPGNLDAIHILQNSFRCQPDLVVICGKTLPLINKAICRKIGFDTDVKNLILTKSLEPLVYFLKPMTLDQRFIYLAQKNYHKKGDQLLIDLSMSANPLADLQLLKNNMNLVDVTHLDLSYSQIRSKELSPLIMFIANHLPKIDEIIYTKSESWSAEFYAAMRETPSASSSANTTSVKDEEIFAAQSRYKSQLLNLHRTLLFSMKYKKPAPEAPQIPLKLTATFN